MRHARILVACWFAASCAESPDAAPEDLTLRVSTHFGVGNVEPGHGGPGVAATLTNLVYRPLREQFSDIHVDGATVVLTPKPGSSADTLHRPSLKAVRAEGDKVIVELTDPLQTKYLDLEWQLLDTGPYRQRSLEGDLLVLARRSGKGPNVIEVRSVPTEEEEWRRFLAREVDVLPYATPAHLARLRELPSVRILEIKRPVSAALHFRVHEGSPLAEIRLRRAIAAGIRRGALAEVITGRRDQALSAFEDLDAARALAAQLGLSAASPLKLKTILHDSASEFARATLILEQQLAVIGVDLEIEALPIEDLMARVRGRDWDALLFFGANDPRYYFWVETGSPGNVGGYSNPDFDAAIKQGDHDRARAILEREVPFTPLYGIREAAALDATLCAEAPESAGDLTWLASVHRCDPGEGG